MVFYFILWHFNHCCLKNHFVLYRKGEHREREFTLFKKVSDYHNERSNNMPSVNIKIIRLFNNKTLIVKHF